MESKRAKLIADIFHEASEADNTAIASVILSRVGSDSLVIEQISKNNTIHEVSQTGNVALLKELISLGVKIDCLNDDGKSPLHIACENTYSEVVEELLKNGANPNLKCKSIEYKRSPMHLVFEKGYIEENNEINKQTIAIIECLLRYGADINAENGLDQTSLLLATVFENVAAVKLLLKNGAKTNGFVEKEDNPLCVATEHNYIDIVEELLKYGAEINPKDSDGIPLYIASKRGHFELVSKFIDFGANVNIQDCFSRTPLYASSKNGHLETVKKLLKHGANPNLKIADHTWPIIVATNGEHLDIVKELLKHGANINVAEEEEFYTPLHKAALCGYATIVKEFLSHGANVNAKTLEDETVLHVAIRHNFYDHYQESLEIIQLLLEDKSIDLNLKNEDGLTPQEKALKLKHMEIAKMISKKM